MEHHCVDLLMYMHIFCDIVFSVILWCSVISRSYVPLSFVYLSYIMVYCLIYTVIHYINFCLCIVFVVWCVTCRTVMYLLVFIL